MEIRFHLVLHEELQSAGDAAAGVAGGQRDETQPVARIVILRGSAGGEEFFDFQTLDCDGQGG